MPLTAFAAAVFDPPSKLPLLSVSVTGELSVVTTLPNASSTSTVTAGLTDTPAVVFIGCCPYASLLACAALIVKLLLGPEGVSDPSVADKVLFRATATLRPLKVAISLHDSVPVLFDPPSKLPLLSVSVTGELSVVTTLLSVSVTGELS